MISVLQTEDARVDWDKVNQGSEGVDIEKVKSHTGHKLTCVVHHKDTCWEIISIECEDCDKVILTWTTRKHKATRTGGGRDEIPT